jgi:hypothetical protein
MDTSRVALATAIKTGGFDKHPPCKLYWGGSRGGVVYCLPADGPIISSHHQF